MKSLITDTEIFTDIGNSGTEYLQPYRAVPENSINLPQTKLDQTKSERQSNLQQADPESYLRKKTTSKYMDLDQKIKIDVSAPNASSIPEIELMIEAQRMRDSNLYQ